MAYYDGYLNFETKLDDSGMTAGLSKLKSLATKSAVAIGSGIAAGLAAATKAGMDFEAQMSKVQAISGANAEELALLNEKAKQMGSATKFTATEAGEALEYMAMAGWKTEDMLSGLSGIMNLAAASGENLGEVSDIVTDALTAFGLKAEDSAHFADVLAMASSNSNTNVGLMGATFKYVAPVAGAMKFSIEDTAQAIGLMANAGIKGEQAGTSLRAMFTRLAKPPKDAAEALDALNLSITNTDGSFQPLGTILSSMREKFAALTDEQKTQYAAALAGQEAMSGLLAIVNASDSDFDKLAGAIATADGASQNMADTMNDNLKGQLVLLESAAESFGLSVYDGIQEPMKKAVKSGIASVNKLTDSINGGELESAITNIGELFGGLVSGAIKITETALPAVVHLTSAVTEHSGVILTAAGAVAGYKASLATLAATGQVLSWGKSFSQTIAAITSAKQMGIGYSTLYRAAMLKDEAALKLCNAAGLKDIVIKGGQVTATNAATGATLTLNKALLANPAGLVVGALALLTVGVVAYAKSSAWLTEEQKEQREAMKTLCEESEALAAAQSELISAQDERVNSIKENAAVELSEIDYAQQLFSKLTELADETGRVTEENSGLASFILGELNSALGTQYSMTGNQINGYREMKSAVNELIEREQARIALAAYSDILTEALKDEAEAKKNAAEASEKMKAAQEAEKQLAEEFVTVYKKYSGQTITLSQAQEDLANNHWQGSLRLKELCKRYVELDKSVNDNRSVIEQSGKAIIAAEEAKMQYQNAAVENEKGNFAKVNSAALLSAEQRKTIENTSAAELADAVIANGEEIERLEKAKNEARTEEERRGWENLLAQERGYGAQLAQKMEQTGALSAEGIAAGLISPEKLEKVKAALRKISDLIPDVLKNLLGIHSPSRVMRDEVGAQIVAGIAEGINLNGSFATDALERLNSDMLESELSYLREKERMEAENETEEERKKEKQYQEKLAKAKNAAERAEIIEEERLRKKKAVDEEYLEQLKNTADAEREILDDLQKDITKLYNEIAERAEKNIDDVVKNREKFAEKLKDYAEPYMEKTSTFTGLGEHGEDLVYTDIILDLSGARKELEDYAKLLREVEQREIIPRDMFTLLRDLPIADAVKYAGALLSATDEELSAYVQDWTAIRQFSEDTGAVLFGEDMKAAADDAAQYMKERLEEAGFEVPEGFFTSGSISAEKFGEGFVGGLEEVMTNIREKLESIFEEFQSASVRLGQTLAPKIAASSASSGATYNTTYNLVSSGESVSRQIQTIEAAEAVKKLRGM